jgi:uncharacterized protein (DUF1800 family)
MKLIQNSHHALNRFGLGPRPDEAEKLLEPHAWLVAQSKTVANEEKARFSALPSSADYLKRESDYLIERVQQKKAGDSMRNNDADNATKKKAGQQAGFRRVFADAFKDEFLARYSWAVTTPAGFRERLTRFWSNHFAVSLDKRTAALYAVPMEREVIRPRISDKYEDLLIAVAQHPAMLRYLDNVASVGVDSTLAMRQKTRNKNNRKLGLNENLAREILELHTLGVEGGYTQNDVTEFARALTGWSVPRPRQLAEKKLGSAFEFYEQAHQPGTRTVLGRRYAESGEAQARSILKDLAQHPATAKHLATKLTQHFVADQAPPAMVARLAKIYLDNDGDMSAVYRALIESPEAWDQQYQKLRVPDDWLVAAIRISGINIETHLRLSMDLLAKMGQPTLTPKSPAGYADRAVDWSGPDALLKRVQAAQLLARWVGRDHDPLALAKSALGPELEADLSLSLRRAESPQQAYAMLFASPAFQWR